ncbi:hypothetical protein AAV94_02705 [Lampropedia cohaerens]|uniref:Lipoprotein n=2 Tax=Lampropedia cohaerens TaxID=1610491 RepID=A0A0U1Q276_9BURK|nr:hypothetical protein AAV94_02705 [Lampropedia cohaerens]
MRAVTLACVATLAACGGGSSDVDIVQPPPATDDDHGHDHDHEPVAGRLVVAQAGVAQVHVLDLEHARLLQSFNVDDVPSAVHASPDHRYALLVQRTRNQVQFVDGGLWQEDHGDHQHPYAENPTLLASRLTGPAPTHYVAHAREAAVFFDGDAQSGENAAIALVSDASIDAGQAGLVLAEQRLDTAHHGLAVPRGDHLLASWRAPDARGLPDRVALYHRHGDHFHLEKTFDEALCPGLHGGGTSIHYTVFGCSDGVLIVREEPGVFTASKLPNPPGLSGSARIGSIIGSTHDERFVGLAGPDQLFEINPAAGTVLPIGWSDSQPATIRAQAMDAAGEHLLVLDALGTLRILDTHDWRAKVVIPSAIAAMPQEAPFPAIAISAAEDRAWLSDPQANRLCTLDLAVAELHCDIPLNFSPTGLVWLGIAEHEH